MYKPDRSATPYASLAELQSAHEQLLEQLPDEEVSLNQRAGIEDLLQRAAATGSLLESFVERRQAQGIIDYWLGTLFTRFRASSIEQGSLRSLTATGVVLAEFDRKRVAAVLAAADRALAQSSPADARLMFRLLQQLVRLNSDGVSFAASSSSRVTLVRTLQAPAEKVDEIISRLEKLDLVQVERRATPDENRVGLKYASIIVDWQAFAAQLDRRRGFRKKVSIAALEHDSSQVVSDEQLDEARGYRDLNVSELEFVSRSRAYELARARNKQNQIYVLSGLCLVLISGLLAVTFYRGKIRAEGDAEQAKTDAKTAQDERVKAIETKDEAVADYKQVNKEALWYFDKFKVADEQYGKLIAATTKTTQEITQVYRDSNKQLEAARLAAKQILENVELRSATKEKAHKAYDILNELIDEQWVDEVRKEFDAGYDPLFIGTELPLPKLSDALRSAAASEGMPLPYAHYSLIYHTARKTALLAAANCNRELLLGQSRSADVFILDARIPAADQLGADFYLGAEFDRGHYVSRSDVSWFAPPSGSAAKQPPNFQALTNVYTNVSPQSRRFNQIRWANIEQWAREKHNPQAKRISLFTGPVLRDDDPLWKGIPVPRTYWKIAVSQHPALPKRLVVDAFMADQLQAGSLEPIDSGGPTDARSFRVDVAMIEGLTGLDFGSAVREASRTFEFALPSIKIDDRLRDQILSRQSKY